LDFQLLVVIEGIAQLGRSRTFQCIPPATQSSNNNSVSLVVLEAVEGRPLAGRGVQYKSDVVVIRGQVWGFHFEGMSQYIEENRSSCGKRENTIESLLAHDPKA
jgi:hypothetical protein